MGWILFWLLANMDRERLSDIAARVTVEEVVTGIKKSQEGQRF